jgi:hypothetical protein
MTNNTDLADPQVLEPVLLAHSYPCLLAAHVAQVDLSLSSAVRHWRRGQTFISFARGVPGVRDEWLDRHLGDDDVKWSHRPLNDATFSALLGYAERCTHLDLSGCIFSEAALVATAESLTSLRVVDLTSSVWSGIVEPAAYRDGIKDAEHQQRSQRWIPRDDFVWKALGYLACCPHLEELHVGESMKPSEDDRLPVLPCIETTRKEADFHSTERTNKEGNFG